MGCQIKQWGGKTVNIFKNISKKLLTRGYVCVNILAKKGQYKINIYVLRLGKERKYECL